jgi:hypothetical protein
MKHFATFALLALLCACGSKDPAAPATPSRAAADGCEWAPFEARGLGVSLLYEKCREERFALAEEGNAIVLKPAGGGEAQRIVEVFTKREMQPIDGAIREQFVSGLEEKERIGCAVQPSPRMRINGLQTLQILPGSQYAVEVEKRREAGPAAVCGDHGDDQSLRFFLYQPEVTKIRFAYVDAGQDHLWFDETSVRMLPDEVADAAVRELPIESLPLAERYAATVEGRLDKLARKTGQYVDGEHNFTWAAFREGSAIVLIVEQAERGEQGSGSIRYFFKDGKLALARESSLGAVPHGNARGTQPEILRVLAFAPDGRVVSSRQTINGKGVPLAESEAGEALARASGLLKRVQGE